MDKSEVLLDDLKQIYTQYQKEVPSKRKPWPESIRDRVSQLQQQGVSCRQISDETGIPTWTIYGWAKKRSKKNSFLPVKVITKNESLVTTPRVKPVTVTKLVTVTIVMPSGIRVEGLSANLAMEMVKKLRL